VAASAAELPTAVSIDLLETEVDGKGTTSGVSRFEVFMAGLVTHNNRLEASDELEKNGGAMAAGHREVKPPSSILFRKK
jgi:hypothetical protein